MITIDQSESFPALGVVELQLVWKKLFVEKFSIGHVFEFSLT